jgi:hypothetical protein
MNIAVFPTKLCPPRVKAQYLPVFGPSAISSRSVPRPGAGFPSTHVRRVLDNAGVRAHPHPGAVSGRRMRRKAVITCDSNQEAYSLPSSRCSR